MPQQNIYAQQVNSINVNPHGFGALQDGSDFSRLPEALKKASGVLLSKIAADHVRSEQARINESMLNAKAILADAELNYNQNHQGKDAANAAMDYLNAAKHVQDVIKKDYGGEANEVFQQELQRQLTQMGYEYARKGTIYQAQEQKKYEDSIFEGQIEAFKNSIQQNYNNPEALKFDQDTLIQSWMDRNPGMDKTAFEYQLNQMREEGIVKALISNEHNEEASQLLGVNPYAAAAEMDGKSISGTWIPGTLGGLSRKFESEGSGGMQCVAYDKTGGTSYGTYQFSSKQGSLQEFLKFMRDNGGTAGKEVYARMMAAGNFNTGSQHGQAPDTWKQLCQQGLITPEMEYNYVVQAFYNPALAGIKNQNLQAMIKNNRILAEALFSTAIQHGVAGACQIFNQLYKTGMPADTFVNSLYNERKRHFKSSTPEVRAAAIERMEKEKKLVLQSLASGSPVNTVTPDASSGLFQENAFAKGQPQSVLKYASTEFRQWAAATLQGKHEAIFQKQQQLARLQKEQEKQQLQKNLLSFLQDIPSDIPIEEQKNILYNYVTQYTGGLYDPAISQFMIKEGENQIDFNAKRQQTQNAILANQMIQLQKNEKLSDIELGQRINDLDIPAHQKSAINKICFNSKEENAENIAAIKQFYKEVDLGKTKIDGIDITTPEGQTQYAAKYGMTRDQLEKIHSFFNEGGSRYKVSYNEVEEIYSRMTPGNDEMPVHFFENIRDSLAKNYPGEKPTEEMISHMMVWMLAPGKVPSSWLGKYWRWNETQEESISEDTHDIWEVPDADRENILNGMPSETKEELEKTGKLEETIRNIYQDYRWRHYQQQRVKEE